jgi:hypothetical protein
MFIVNGFKATLIQNNRNVQEDFYDDQDKQEVTIKVIPYNEDQAVKFGIYSVPEATGYFVLPRGTDVKEGDQLIFNNIKYSILKVADNWLFNRIENIGLYVK